MQHRARIPFALLMLALLLFWLPHRALSSSIFVAIPVTDESTTAPPTPASQTIWQTAPKHEVSLVPPPPGTGLYELPMDFTWLGTARLPSDAEAGALLSRFNWREQGKVSAVEDQGACGSCYSFAGLGSLESQILIDGGPTYNFSQNNVKECNWQEANNWHHPTTGAPWGSCDGATSLVVANWLTQKGTVLESCDPYVDRDVNCKTTCSYVKTLTEFRMFTGASTPNPNVLKVALQTYGPLFISMYAGDNDAWATEFSNYRGDHVLYFPYTGKSTNHAVLLVGWDDALQHAGGTGAWIVRNSWGTSWGDQGYFYIAYGSANVGFNAAAFVGYEDYDTHGGLLYYDEAGMWDSVGTSSKTCWGLAKYIAPHSTGITRVEFWTIDATTDVDVYLYDSFDGTTLGNRVWARENLSYSEAGYFTVPVNPPLQVAAGQQVVAVVKFTNATTGYPVSMDPYGPHETQRCYVSTTGPGGQWVDLASIQGLAPADVGIRLRYSDPQPTPTATLRATPTKTKTVPPFTPTHWVRLPIVLKNFTRNTVPSLTPNGNKTSTPTRTLQSPGLTSTPTRTPQNPGPTPTGIAPTGGPDQFGYTYDATVPFDWVDTAGGVIIPGGDDWYRGPYNIGFDFKFYGVTYRQLWIDTNGFMHFDGTKGYNDIPNTSIPNASRPNSLAALFWDDLKPISTGIIRYKLFGSAPRRYLVVEFNNVGHYRDFEHGMTFEAILFEGSNDIKFQYQSMSVNLYGDGRDGSVGIEDSPGRIGLQYCYNQQGAIRDSMAILFSYPQ